MCASKAVNDDRVVDARDMHRRGKLEGKFTG